MSNQSLDLQFKGLYTSPNQLSAVPKGSLLVANNVVIDDESLVKSRRGMDIFSYAFGSSSDRLKKLFFFGGNKISHYGTTLAYSTGTTWTTYSGSYSAPTNTKITSAELNKNLYLATSTGIIKIDSISETPESCGVPKAINMELATATGTWLANGYTVNYRVVWGIKDANSNLILGAASQVQSVTNSSGSAKAVALTIYIPSGITTSHFFQVYRSIQTSASVASEELALVYEDNPVAGDITAGYVTCTDICTDDLRGAACYISPTQQGIGQNNDRPPLGKVITAFKNCLFVGNTTSKHRYIINLLGTGTSGTALQADDTLVVNSVTYTAKAAENSASRQFKVFTGGSVATDIRDTCLSLCKVINADATATVYASYLSGVNDVPGKILIEERSIGGSAFSISASRTTCFSPSSIPTSGTAETSTNDEWKNGLFYSKQGLPEAFPLLNYVRVGSADKGIKAFVPLKDALFIFKEDGVFRLTGDGPHNFSVDLLDNTAVIVGPETACALSNQIFALTTQGVSIISDSGVSVISRPIESDILSLYGTALSTIRSYAFGVGYETDRKYILFLPSTSSDTYCTQAYVYNTFTSSWTRWTNSATCGVVSPSDDKLYLGSSSDNYIRSERKAYDYTDYVDWYSTETISAVSSTTVTLSGTDNIEVGDLLYQSSTVFAWVDSVNSQTGTVTTTLASELATGSVTIYKGIDTTVKWVAQVEGNPGALKNFQEVLFLFQQNLSGDATCTFSTDTSPGEVEVGITTSTDLGLWGLAPWGSFPWGGVNVTTPTRVLVPRESKRGSQLFIQLDNRWAFSEWQLAGLSVIFNTGSTRVGR